MGTISGNLQSVAMGNDKYNLVGVFVVVRAR